jgi:uncharacterized protein with PQ loop repeat
MSFTQMAGILPAIVFPVATLAQLVRMLRNRSAAGVSVTTWLLFGFANLAIYIYAERYGEWQAIVGMLLTAVIDFVIVGVALCCFRTSGRTDERVPHADPAGRVPALPRR